MWCLLESWKSVTTDGVLAAGGDFIGVTCLTTFTAGSVPGDSSTPACSITINNDLLVEQDETFSLNASIQISNGQSVQFSAGGNSASATITDDDGMLAWDILLPHCRCTDTLLYMQLRENFCATISPKVSHIEVYLPLRWLFYPMQLHSCGSPSQHTLRMKTITRFQSVLCWTHLVALAVVPQQ